MTEITGYELEAIFKQVPLLAKFRPDDFEIETLTGFTNLNLHLKNDQHDWVLRIPKQETNQYINRQHETYNSDLASKLGIAPECVWSAGSGLSLTMTLLNSRSINRQDLKNDSVFKSLLKTISQLHKSKIKFKGRVDLTELITRYYHLAPRQNRIQIEPGYKKALKKITILSNRKMPLVPSHNDLVLENILIDVNGQIWIIDWEYSSMASPYWDLATLCNAANLNQARSIQVLDEYQQESDDMEIEILFEYRFVLNLLSICWMAAFTGIDPGPEIEKLNS